MVFILVTLMNVESIVVMTGSTMAYTFYNCYPWSLPCLDLYTMPIVFYQGTINTFLGSQELLIPKKILFVQHTLICLKIHPFLCSLVN